VRTYGQFCPIARASELLGERWSVIILRNILIGCRTFNEIADGAPGLSRGLLSKRLRELARAGVIEIQAKPDGPGSIYQPTRVESLTFATNVLGYYLVTNGLLDALKAGAPSRVVNVASTFASDLDLDDLQFERRPYDGMTAYAQSKACDRMLTCALARRLQAEPVTVNAMAPGLVLGTSLYRHLTPAAKRGLEQYGSRSVPAGAETAAWLASSPQLHGVTGRFFEQGTDIPCHFRDEDAEERLWQTCQQLVKQLELKC